MKTPGVVRSSRRVVWTPCRTGVCLAVSILALSAMALRAQDLIPRTSRVFEVEGRLAFHEFQVFRIDLERGEYFRLAADQDQIDVVLRVFAPDGSEVATGDRHPPGPLPEMTEMVAVDSGSYCVEVSSSSLDPGGYRLRVEPPRPATEEDRYRSLARLAMRDGLVRLEIGHTRLDTRAAKQDLDFGFEVWRLVGDQLELGRAMSSHAMWPCRVAPVTCFEPLREAAEMSHRAGDGMGELESWEALGDLHHQLGNLAESMDSYHRAQSALVPEYPPYLYNIYCDLGWLYLDLGREDEGEKSFRRALEAARVHGPYMRGLPLMGIGATLRSLGEYSAALSALDESVRVFRGGADTISEGHALIQVAETRRVMGQPELAREASARALALARSVSYRWLECGALNHLARDLVTEGLLSEAMGFFQEAVLCSGSIQASQLEAEALTNIGTTALKLGDLHESARSLDRALKLRAQLGGGFGEIPTRHALGMLESARGDFFCAREHLEMAIALGEAVRRRAERNETRIALSGMVSRIYETYIDVIMRLHERDGSAGFDSEALAASESSRAMALLRVLNESGANLRRDISPELAERDRALGVRLSAKLEQQMRLVPGSESERRAAELAAEIVELKGERDRLDAEMRTSNPEFASILLPRALGAAALRERLLDDRTLLIEFAVGTDRGYAWALSREGLRSYSLPERDRLDRLSRAAYESLRRHPTTASARPVRETRELRELSDLLLKPVASELRAHSRLLVVADGPLEYLPLGLLPAPWTGRRQRLFRTHEVISIPSGTTAAHLRNEGRRSKSGPGLIAVLADPVFEPDDARVGGHPNGSVPGDPESALSRSAAFVGLGSGEKVRIPRLPFSRYEAQEISRLTTPAARLVRLDFNATRESAMDPRLGGFRIVHFATHGFLNSEHPELSGLVLSLVDKSGHSIPGYVSVSDTFSLRLPVDLVVLSGCQTALGKEIRGEGLVGLSRGFMYAGARAVMASLWKIDDQASAEFMKRFYRFLLSDAAGSPAAALRATQLDLAASKKWSDPFYWGGFVIQGEGALDRPERSKDSRKEPIVLPSRPAP